MAGGIPLSRDDAGRDQHGGTGPGERLRPATGERKGR
ncbi:hypothetical protein STRAU_0616 [Streptomyces aurantiacus JA 4570]|uniref:Uncharacterized protein n=1 Tax=Streptomyces aurantiacus JA 4570 TaxID=1286094 RepID=S3ZSF2_9ACTN|nr:hypothetical protein STRAU_0616 [Streptomyces aurantiacus JA 4570]